MTDSEYMHLALQLARKGAGRVSPNPMVGAVIVKDGVVIGQGYHQQYGGLHAERNALAACTAPPQGATLYVTLEPCCHYGKTPPCTEAILENGIARVVIGSDDPNPLVAGKGIEILRSHGVQVTTHVLQAECDKLNEVFFHFIQSKTPYVVMKYAMTLDGKIATKTGASQWITGEIARRRVHEDRNRYSAIMAGVGTVLADNPQLTCRIEGGRNPVRIICDTHLRTPLTAQVVTTANSIPTILATSEPNPACHQPYLDAGCQVVTVPQRDGHLDLNALMEALGAQNIDSILLEGGGTLNWTALQSGIVQKVQAYVAPKLFGGTAKNPVMGLGVELPDQAVQLTSPTVTRLGEDLLLESEVIPCSPES
ncbi:MAG: bifunctional diaminohydroxyphosphoribosylaminopyrimidine deaminase/5-amino-6-(5-phosphoribosylamino)uracil reductase RibD [Candidatus Onthomonas sp.]|nr:bifunctional diaminohydroxyphosphoribosylaminopyrimidine deaminase/5-amino-6-(5-phosphoribosylamino)uracil reductase RibD [Candidatus Onthomonas sp.]